MALPTYLERYRAGEHRRVWAELAARGPDVRAEPLLGDALAVARETMRRARHNVALLIGRLRAIDYRFAHPATVWVPPDADTGARLAALEGDYGALPLSLRAWYEIVGAVDLSGAHPLLASHHGLDQGRSGPPGAIAADPLVVYGPPPSPPCPYYLHHADDEDEEAALAGPPYEAPIAPDAALKAGRSGGGAMAILFPNPAADAPLVGADEWDGVPFVEHLREAFAWGGFPGFRRDWPDHAAAVDAARRAIARLRADFLPL